MVQKAIFLFLLFTRAGYIKNKLEGPRIADFRIESNCFTDWARKQFFSFKE